MTPEALPLVRCKRCGVGGRQLSHGTCIVCWRELDDMLRPSYECMRRAHEIIRTKWWNEGIAVKCEQVAKSEVIHQHTT